MVHGAIIADYTWSENVIKAKITIEDGSDDAFIKKEFYLKHKLFHSIAYEARTLTAPSFGKTGTDSKTSVNFGYSF